MDGKILLIDIETAPNLAWVWGKYEQDVISFDQHWYILTFSAKWLGKRAFVKGLCDYKLYQPGSEDDSSIVGEIKELLDEADVVIAHNGASFDLKKINTRLTIHGFDPPSPYKIIDTKLVARRYFGFDSNKLDDLGAQLKLGRKAKHEGFDMWKGCMLGDKESWRKMKMYNKQDVLLLEKIYLHFRGWINNHPNMGNFLDKPCCPKCGCEDLQQRGFQYNQTTKFKRFQCLRCGGWGRTKHNIQKSELLV